MCGILGTFELLLKRDGIHHQLVILISTNVHHWNRILTQNKKKKIVFDSRPLSKILRATLV